MKPKNCSTYGSFVQMRILDDFELTDIDRKIMNGPWRVWDNAI